MQKGLFSSLFVLIMIIFFTPSLMISDPSFAVTNTYNHLNLLTLSADNVIVDALLEQTFDNACVVSSASEYNTKINTYLSSLRSQTSNNFMVCSNTPSNGGFEGSTNIFAGSITFTCTLYSENLNLDLKKNFSFRKSISATITPGDPINPGDPDTCQVTITDLLDNNETFSLTRDMP